MSIDGCRHRPLPLPLLLCRPPSTHRRRSISSSGGPESRPRAAAPSTARAWCLRWRWRTRLPAVPRRRKRRLHRRHRQQHQRQQQYQQQQYQQQQQHPHRLCVFEATTWPRARRASTRPLLGICRMHSRRTRRPHRVNSPHCHLPHTMRSLLQRYKQTELSSNASEGARVTKEIDVILQVRVTCIRCPSSSSPRRAARVCGGGVATSRRVPRCVSRGRQAGAERGREE